MGRVVRIIAYGPGFPNPATDPHVGRFLSSYDIEAPYGGVETTDDPDEALLFPDFATAYEAMRATSTVTPFRDDGKPNRPLTAWTVEITRWPARVDQ